MKMRPGGKPSSEMCGSNSNVPSSSRRSETRTLVRGIFARSVKFSFRSIAGIDHAHHEVAARIESFHRDLKLCRGRHDFEGIDRGGAQTCALGVHVDALFRHQVEIERAVL